jgi:hypothetical protein
MLWPSLSSATSEVVNPYPIPMPTRKERGLGDGDESFCNCDQSLSYLGSSRHLTGNENEMSNVR